MRNEEAKSRVSSFLSLCHGLGGSLGGRSFPVVYGVCRVQLSGEFSNALDAIRLHTSTIYSDIASSLRVGEKQDFDRGVCGSSM